MKHAKLNKCEYQTQGYSIVGTACSFVLSRSRKTGVPQGPLVGPFAFYRTHDTSSFLLPFVPTGACVTMLNNTKRDLVTLSKHSSVFASISYGFCQVLQKQAHVCSGSIPAKPVHKHCLHYGAPLSGYSNTCHACIPAGCSKLLCFTGVIRWVLMGRPAAHL